MDRLVTEGVRVKPLNDESVPGTSAKFCSNRVYSRYRSSKCVHSGDRSTVRDRSDMRQWLVRGGSVKNVGSLLRVREKHRRDGCREGGDRDPAERVRPAVPLLEDIAKAPAAPCHLTDAEAQECGPGGLTCTVALQYRAQPLFRLLILPV